MSLSIMPHDEVRTDALAGSGNGRGGRSWQVGKEEPLPVVDRNCNGNCRHSDASWKTIT
jgi:hypothetical protein